MKRELPRRQLEAIVERQLGRPASIRFRVAVFCDYGWPAVIASDPFRDDAAPNPNILYLTCPYLRRELALLEDRGAIRELEDKVAKDVRLKEQLAAAQSQHARAWQETAGGVWPGGPAGSPRIAAASRDTALKCLHAHMAWYLAHGDYALGALLEERIGARWCQDERCAAYCLESAEG